MPNDLPSDVSAHPDGLELITPENKAGTSLRDMERELIRSTLQQTDGNKSQTAIILGIARQTLQNKIKEYDLK
jgi:DNA-binding NtrC family response regulator